VATQWTLNADTLAMETGPANFIDSVSGLEEQCQYRPLTFRKRLANQLGPSSTVPAPLFGPVTCQGAVAGPAYPHHAAITLAGPPAGLAAASLAEDGATQLNKGTATVASCMTDTDCRVSPQGANAQVFCIPDDAGAFPGTCYVAKNRYISIAPNPANAGLLTARRVSKDVNASGAYESGTDTVLGWVVAPVTSRNATGEPAPQKQSTIDPIAVPPAAYYIDWTDQGAFATNIVHVGDAEICPGRTYLVQEIVLGQDVTVEAGYSSATKLPTVTKWGDVLGGASGSAPQNTTNFGDALGIIQGFSAAQSVSKVWLDLEPESPNFAAVGFPDVLRCTQAIASQPYPFPGCP